MAVEVNAGACMAPVAQGRSLSHPASARAMEIAEYCRTIVFGDTLADKLVEIADLSDRRPGSGVEVPRAPGRPRALSFPDEGSRRSRGGKFPGADALQREVERGRALHFFANHELLALELMALTLLRFPQAPANFRRRTVTTMREEQKHLRAYLARMQALGVEFGEIPVSPFFWRCLSDVDTLSQYVSGMALTFEQANLDFALHYEAAFATVGDRETATLMREVYEDEVGHVKHGLSCLRAWKPEAVDDFSAHRAALRLPLNLSRAKGSGFSEAARRKVGFDAGYIRELAAFRGSRGRAPGVYIFNPSCEFEIIVGDAYNPPRVAEQLERDLETLPQYYCANDDVLLVRALPRSEYMLEQSERRAVVIPEFAEIREHRREIRSKTVWHPRLTALEPWGWSPVAVRRMAGLRARLHPQARARIPGVWDTRRELLHRKSTACAWLERMLEEPWVRAHLDRFCGPELVGRVCRSTRAVEATMADMRAATRSGDVAIKAPLGTSGKNIIRVRDGAFVSGQRGWVVNVLAAQGEVVVEPWLDKQFDLSTRGFIHPDGRVEWRGRAQFFTDQRGQYLAGRMGDFRAWPRAWSKFAHADGLEQGWLERALRSTLQFVGQSLFAGGYSGPVGIDALVYRTRDGARLALKPIVEVNPRFTMGHVLRGIARRICSAHVGLWTLLRVEDVVRAGFADVPEFVAHCHQVAAPTHDAGQRCFQRGVWFTTDPLRAQQVLSMAVVGTDSEDCRGLLAAIGAPVHALADLLR